MGFTTRHALIISVKYGCTFCTVILKVTNTSRNLRLSAAVDAAARAGHDFNEGIICFACTNLVHDSLCIGKSGCDCNLNAYSACFISSFLNSFESTNFLEFDRAVVGFAGQFPNCGTKSCFHNTTGNTEDNSCTGTLAHGIGVRVLW